MCTHSPRAWASATIASTPGPSLMLPLRLLSHMTRIWTPVTSRSRVVRRIGCPRGVRAAAPAQTNQDRLGPAPRACSSEAACESMSTSRTHIHPCSSGAGTRRWTWSRAHLDGARVASAGSPTGGSCVIP